MNETRKIDARNGSLRLHFISMIAFVILFFYFFYCTFQMQ